MSGHTPGPWTFSKDDQLGDTRFYIAQEEGAPYTPDYSDVATLIAETCSGDRVRVQEANARLIAAAPELLEALQRLIPHAHFMTMCATAEDHIVVAAVDRARDAIAKATGATP